LFVLSDYWYSIENNSLPVEIPAPTFPFSSALYEVNQCQVHESISIDVLSCVDQDGAEPSSNSVSAHNLLRLAAIMDSSSYRQRAEAMFAAFSSHLENIPVAVPEMLRALMLYSLPVEQVLK